MSDRREQIVAAAEEIRAEDGWSGVSVRAVARRTGIGASTLRYYFPTQRDLHDALVARSMQAQLGDLRLRDTSVPAPARLTECVGQFLPTPDAGRGEVEALMSTYLAAMGPSATDAGTQLLAAMAGQARERVDSWLEALMAEGAIDELEPAPLVTLLLAVVDGLCLEMVTPASAVTPGRAHELLADAVDRLVPWTDAATR